MATNFFEQQDATRRQTGVLILCFVLAVVAIILSVYGAVTVLLANLNHGGRPIDLARLAAVAAVVLLVIVAGSLYKMAVLQEGGAAVARLLGGRLVDTGA